MSEKKDQPKFPTYKGKPLVRCGDVIYYGSMKDKYVVKLEIKSKKKVQDMDGCGPCDGTVDVYRP